MQNYLVEIFDCLTETTIYEWYSSREVALCMADKYEREEKDTLCKVFKCERLKLI